MRSDTTSPTTRLLTARTLVSRPGGATVAELMANLGASRATVMRYLRALPEIGTVLESEWRGSHKAYTVPQRSRGASIIMTELEMVSVAVARQILRYLDGTPFGGGLAQVFGKIESSLKRKNATAHLARKIFDVNEGELRFRARDRDNLEALVDALLREDKVRITHARIDSGRVAFEVLPYTLLFHRKGPYLVGKSLHPPHAGAIRTFAFDGIRSIEWLRGERFPYPATYSPEHTLRNAFGIVGGKAETIVVRFDAKVARSVTRRKWHRSQRVKKRAGGELEVTLRCAASFEVTTWVLSWGANAEVISPVSLREEVAREAKAMSARYTRTTGAID